MEKKFSLDDVNIFDKGAKGILPQIGSNIMENTGLGKLASLLSGGSSPDLTTMNTDQASAEAAEDTIDAADEEFDDIEEDELYSEEPGYEQHIRSMSRRRAQKKKKKTSGRVPTLADNFQPYEEFGGPVQTPVASGVDVFDSLVQEEDPLTVPISPSDPLDPAPVAAPPPPQQQRQQLRWGPKPKRPQADTTRDGTGLGAELEDWETGPEAEEYRRAMATDKPVETNDATRKHRWQPHSQAQKERFKQGARVRSVGWEKPSRWDNGLEGGKEDFIPRNLLPQIEAIYGKGITRYSQLKKRAGG